MTDRVEIAGAAISAILMIVVIELVRRRKLTEEYSVLMTTSPGLRSSREMDSIPAR